MLVRYFFRGLAAILPAGLTVYLFYLLFSWVDSLLPFPYPGPGFVLAVVVTFIVGYLVSNVWGERVVRWLETSLGALPVVGMLFRSVKDVTEAVLGDHSRFQHPVLVQPMEESETRLLGFLTDEEVDIETLDDHVAVYLPQSYNIGGNLVLVPRQRVREISLSGAETMRFVISGGLTGGKVSSWHDLSDTNSPI